MTGRDRRALLVGGSVVAVAVLILRVVPWAVTHAVAASRELRDRAALVAQGREKLARTALLRDSAARITQALVSLAPKLLGGSSAAEAGAGLSGLVNLAATRHHAKVEQLYLIPDSGRAGQLGRVRSRVMLETDIRGLTEFLQALAAADAVLEISELRIVAPDPSSLERVPEILKVEASIQGWYLRDRAAGRTNQ